MEIEIIDNFLVEPHAVKTIVSSLRFNSKNPDDPATGTVVKAPYWQECEIFFPTMPRSCFFRRGDNSFPKVNIHSDRSMGVKAAILYLNEEHEWPKGLEETPGTIFYRNVYSGAMMPDRFDNRLNFQEAYFTNKDNWEAVKHVEMKFNRLIYYDSRLYHGRANRCHWANRLVQTMFF